MNALFACNPLIILYLIKYNLALGYNLEERQKAETIIEIPQGSSRRLKLCL